MPRAFKKTIAVYWSDCDAAGIVYYPKFFDMINEVTEDWFGQALGTSYADLIQTQHIGFPTVRVNCDFLVPCRYGEDVEISLSVSSLGRSSMALDFTGRIGDKACLRATHTLVMMSKDTYSALPIPKELRALIEPYLDPKPVAGEASV